MAMAEMFTQLGSAAAGLMFLSAVFQQYFPFDLGWYIRRYANKIGNYLNPYMQINFPEFSVGWWKREDAFIAIQEYLSVISPTRAKRLKANVINETQSIVAYTMDDYEEVTDDYHGVRLWWVANKTFPNSQSISFYPVSYERRSYTLTFHRRHRDLVVGSYVNHVIKEGKAVAARQRQQKLYTNNPSKDWDGSRGSIWSHVAFEHPATFETLAMDSKRKEDIVRDLTAFRARKEYYSKIGKAWKRGYLLHGPPGTGKSSMIAAMANLLSYDIYDLELTSVKDNIELRKLLIETTTKSIIVIEDIDCSLDLTCQREKKKEKDDNDGEDESSGKAEINPISKTDEESSVKKENKLTLSGLLNFIDGLWSACGVERIIVFTTNHVDKLDPALIRRGRMDMHIELSYCRFDAFKVLAKNYMDLVSHPLFPTISRLLEEVDMTPADVAEILLSKSTADDDPETGCLENLIRALGSLMDEEADERLRKEKPKKKTKIKEETLA